MYQIGILGGGQLGRMLLQRAISWDLSVKILDPNPKAPCATIATTFVTGALTDYQTVLDFGQDCQVISIEIENVNTQALRELQRQGKTVIPSPASVELIQDKRMQKKFYQSSGIPTAPFVLIENKAALSQYLDKLPAVNKLGREGYDGRGVQILRSEADLKKGFDAPGLLEDLADIRKEVAVMIARKPEGEVKTYPPTEVVYHAEHNLVDYLLAPAQIPDSVAKRADAIARKVVEEMDFVGLLAVELFWTNQDEIWVNEVAPRPHNSGHHSIEACPTSQFEQLLRVLMGVKLGETSQKQLAAMVNVLGEAGHTGEAQIEGLEKLLAMPQAFLHLYGKKMTKPFRKMGHITILGGSLAELTTKIEAVKKVVKVVAK